MTHHTNCNCRKSADRGSGASDPFIWQFILMFFGGWAILWATGWL